MPVQAQNREAQANLEARPVRVQAQNREAQANLEAQSQRVNNLGLRSSQDQQYISCFEDNYDERMELRQF